MDIYRNVLRPVLFSGLKTDPEWLHQRSLGLLEWLDRTQERPPAQWILPQFQQTFCLSTPQLEQTLGDLKFPNPVGLAAGFDKDGVGGRIWEKFGFGFAELGTVTFHPQPGNPRPRLFRLPQDKAALNRMGFNNQGSATLAQRLSQWQHSPGGIIGINLGKSKITPLEKAAEDYLGSFQRLKDLGDYFVVNVSSPNTPGLRSLQNSSSLRLILDALQQANSQYKPIFVKISPDLEWEAVTDVLELATSYNLAGIIATNTTIRRDNLQTQIIPATGNLITDEAGGISGQPVRDRSTEIIRFIYQQTQGKLPIIGVGGIFTSEDAWEKITAGATLVQVYTGWIYQGPWMVKEILQGLVRKLKENQLNSISEAIGINNEQ